jgi:hypothetical protein
MLFYYVFPIINIKLSLCLIKFYVMTAYGEWTHS